MLIIVKILWNCCVSITIYVLAYINIKKTKKQKKETNRSLKRKKKKKTLSTVATVPLDN